MGRGAKSGAMSHPGTHKPGSQWTLRQCRIEAAFACGRIAPTIAGQDSEHVHAFSPFSRANGPLLQE